MFTLQELRTAILVSSMDHGSQGSGNSDKMELYKNQAKQMLKKLNTGNARVV